MNTSSPPGHIPTSTPPPRSPSKRLPTWRLGLWGAALLALVTPWFSMQWSQEVNWSRFDFLVVAIMLGTACAGVELAVRLSGHHRYRLGATLTIAGGFLMVWANLAVGIIGSEDNPQNLLFFVILMVGVIGALITRFAAQGLARTLRVMAVAQLLVGLGAWVLDWAFLPVFTLFYVTLWLIAAKLFEEAAEGLS